MSTSLQQQLKRLKTASTSNLNVEKDHSSLIFDSKEASSRNREDFYKVGLSGLLHLKQHLDDKIDTYEPSLFKKSMLDFNRSTLNKEEEEILNKKLERIIMFISPYFHIQAAKQVLEWLIFRYQIHSYNAEVLALALLPYHSTNSYGRLLNILKFSNTDWNFTEDFAKKAFPIPLNVLIRACHGAHNYFLVSRISQFTTDAVKEVGADYVEQKMHHYFTFIATIFTALCEEPTKVDNNLVSRITPFLGRALKSPIGPFKCAGLMIVCNLAMHTSLTTEASESFLNLMLLKVTKPWLELTISSCAVISQYLNLPSLPRKPILKLIKKREELGLIPCLLKLMENHDMAGFIVPFRNTLFQELKLQFDKEDRIEIFSIIVDSTKMDLIDCVQAKEIIESTFSLYDANFVQNRSETEDLRIPKPFRKYIRSLVSRFPIEFKMVHSEWLLKEKETAEQFISYFKIEHSEVLNDEPGSANHEQPKRRRTSS